MSPCLSDNPEVILTGRTKIYLVTSFASGRIATTYSFCSQDKAVKYEKVERLLVFIILLNSSGEILVIRVQFLQ